MGSVGNNCFVWLECTSQNVRKTARHRNPCSHRGISGDELPSSDPRKKDAHRAAKQQRKKAKLLQKVARAVVAADVAQQHQSPT